MVASCTMTTIQLTDSVSHAVKEDPLLFPMNKADIVACFYTDHWQQVQFTKISYFWGLDNILNSVVAPAFEWMDYMWTAITEVSKATCCTLLRSILVNTCWALLPGTLLTDKALILKSRTKNHHNMISSKHWSWNNLHGDTIRSITLSLAAGMIFWYVLYCFPNLGTWISSFNGAWENQFVVTP